MSDFRLKIEGVIVPAAVEGLGAIAVADHVSANLAAPDASALAALAVPADPAKGVQAKPAPTAAEWLAARKAEIAASVTDYEARLPQRAASEKAALSQAKADAAKASPAAPKEK